MGNNSRNVLLPITDAPKFISNGSPLAVASHPTVVLKPNSGVPSFTISSLDSERGKEKDQNNLQLENKQIQLILPGSNVIVSNQVAKSILTEDPHKLTNGPKLNLDTADNGCSFNVEFPHAGAFSALIEYLHGGHGTGTTNQSYFEITDKTLTYTGRDVSKTVLNRATIYSRNTVRFIVDSPKGTYRFFVKLKELRDHLKPFTKKNSVALTKYGGRSQLYIQTSSSSSEYGPQQIQFVNLLPMDTNVSYKVPIYKSQNIDTPNAVIYSPELHKMCKTIVTDRQIEICGTSTSICFGIPGKDEQRPSSVWKFTSPNNNVVIGTNVNSIIGKASGGVIKKLGRLSALAPNAMIWVYFTPENKIKLVAPIEYLGTLDVHITLSQN